MIYLLSFFASLVFTVVITPYVIRYLKRMNILDQPGERKIHETATPRMGGLIIYFVVVVTLFSYATDLQESRLIIFASFVIVISGIWDDILGMRWQIKLIMQAFAGVLMLMIILPQVSSIELSGWNIPFPLNYIIMLLFITGVINAVNMMDGMDGLLSGFSILILMVVWAFAYHSKNPTLVILTSSLAGSTIGFLKFNAYPAKIFLGDTGSQMLGFFLVFCLLLAGRDLTTEGSIDLAFLIIIFGVPVIDTLKVITLRVIRGKNPFLPDKTHLHHIIFGANVRHKTTVFLILSFTLLFMLAGFYYQMVSKEAGLILFAVFSLMLLMVKQLMRFLQDTVIHKFYADKVLNLPSVIAEQIKRSFIPVSTSTLIIMLAIILPGRSDISVDYIIFLSAFSLLLLITALYQSAASEVNDVYVFVNMLMFSVLSQKALPLLHGLNIDGEVTYVLLRLCFLVLLALVTVFILGKERLIGNSLTILSGTDLVILVVISLIILLQNFLPDLRIVLDGGSIALGFLVYLWYKVIILIRPERKRILFYASFMLPLLNLLLLFDF